MTVVRFLFHVHTRCSFDGVMSPRRIIAFCQRRGIQAVAITDHDSDAAIDHATILGERAGVLVIPAVEYSSDDGDVIGLFCRGPIARCSGNQTVAEIKRRGGLAVLPHPVNGHPLHRFDLAAFDFIEVFNARCDQVANEANRQIAAQFKRPGIAAADAHMPWDLRSCVNEVELGESKLSLEGMRIALLRGVRPVIDRTSPRVSIPLSQMVKAYRQRRAVMFVKHSIAAMNHSVRGLWPGRTTAGNAEARG